MKAILFIFLLNISLEIFCQNLVPNSGFEIISQCPTALGQINQSSNWLSPTSSTPDLFHTCSSSFSLVSIPSNVYGTQQTYSGNAYAGFSVFHFVNSDMYREYLQIALTENLIANKKYTVSFFVCLSDSSRYAVNNLGMYLSNNSFFENTLSVINYQPQIQNTENNPLTDKINWVEIKSSFQAIGGERYITIGNFSSDNLTDTIFVGGSYDSYYYIDDVFVGLDTTVNSSEIQLNNESLKVYPNPTKGELTISFQLNGNGVFELYDVLGKKIYSSILDISENNKTISLKSLSEGVYFYKALSEKGSVINTNKIILLK